MGRGGEAARGTAARAVTGPNRLAIAQVVVANAIPVVGVWFLGWQPLAPIFFYWLDGLLAIWGLGVVALVVTAREKPEMLGRPGARRVLLWIGVAGLVWLVLAVPSGIAAAMVFGSLHRDVGDVLRAVFASLGAWFSLALAVATHAGQTIGEVRWRPELTLKESGEARANFFIHRTVAMGLLVFWGGRTTPSHWVLAAYVLLVACLFTYAQLDPERYLRMIGFKKKRQGPVKPAAGSRTGRARPARSAGDAQPR